MANLKAVDLKRIDEETMEGPIVKSLLEDDFYKFSMGGFIEDYPALSKAKVVWEFKNRTLDVLLADFVSEKDFQKEYENVLKLKATKSEIHYLRGTNEYDARMFKEDYLEHLSKLQIPEASFSVKDGQPQIVAEGHWSHSMHAEIPILRIINGLYYRSKLKKMSRMERELVYAEGIRRLAGNISLLKKHPAVKFADFGNRRSFSGPWHEYVTTRFAEELGDQFLGTSKVSLAHEYNLIPIGTCAHELSMCMTGLNFDGTKKSIEDSMTELHERWWKKYGFGLSISLPDTFGTKFLLNILPDHFFHEWKGFRIDSMEPKECIRLFIKKYESLGIDPREKTLIPSDGLDVPNMIEIAETFKDKVKISFGWGTKATNNLGLKQLSIVMKPKFVNGKPCVKIPDNIAKSMGDLEAVKEYKAVLGYEEKYNQICEV